MKLSNKVGTYIDRKEGWKRLISYRVGNSDDTFMLNNPILEIWTLSSAIPSIQKKI